MSMIQRCMPLLALFAAEFVQAQTLPALPSAQKLDEHRDGLDSVLLIRGPLDEKDSERRGDSWLRLQGRSVLTYYRLLPEASTLEVLLGYQQALEAQGFSVLFSCDTSDGSCYQQRPNWSPDTAPYQFATVYDANPELPRLEQDYIRNYFGTRARYLLAAGPVAGQANHSFASLTLTEHSRGNFAFLRVVEVAAPAGAGASAAGSGLLDTLQNDGRARLEGLRFQPGRSALQVGSEAALAPLIQALHASPGLRLAVVGHADADTPEDQAAELALRRAQALVTALIENEGIAAARLQPRASASASEPPTRAAGAAVLLIALAPR